MIETGGGMCNCLGGERQRESEKDRDRDGEKGENIKRKSGKEGREVEGSRKRGGGLGR